MGTLHSNLIPCRRHPDVPRNRSRSGEISLILQRTFKCRKGDIGRIAAGSLNLLNAAVRLLWIVLCEVNARTIRDQDNT